MNKPFLLRPAAKDYLWGGTRLNDDFNLNMDVSPFAEAWVCSTHPDGNSVEAESGKSLSSIIAENPELLGTHPLKITGGRPELPILIKLIDAKEKLSVQVHPDDEYARRVENSWGKTEMWYVLSARPSAELVYGFGRDVDCAEVRGAISDGILERLLNHVPVSKGNLFFIEAGMIHAIGAGILIAEIQENSNITYRLYDYDRCGKNGKRELHIDKALEVVNLSASDKPRQPMRVLRYENGRASELLTRCKYFQVERLLLNSENRKFAEYRANSNSFHALLCIEGCGSLFGDDVYIPFFKGDCIFVPADSIRLNLHGNAQFLDVSC